MPFETKRFISYKNKEGKTVQGLFDLSDYGLVPCLQQLHREIVLKPLPETKGKSVKDQVAKGGVLQVDAAGLASALQDWFLFLPELKKYCLSLKEGAEIKAKELFSFFPTGIPRDRPQKHLLKALADPKKGDLLQLLPNSNNLYRFKDREAVLSADFKLSSIAPLAADKDWKKYFCCLRARTDKEVAGAGQGATPERGR